ncbi:trimethylguanosine synthase-like [Sesbania bispinosa]|nr:trimethylguanosine synthase-like [Sesbania bispinosa]
MSEATGDMEGGSGHGRREMCGCKRVKHRSGGAQQAAMTSGSGGGSRRGMAHICN